MSDEDARGLGLALLTLSHVFNACPVDEVVFACPELTANGWRSMATVPFNHIVIRPPNATADDEEGIELASATGDACNNSLSIRLVTNVGGFHVPAGQSHGLFLVPFVVKLTNPRIESLHFEESDDVSFRQALFPGLSEMLALAPFNLRELSLSGIWDTPPDGPSLALVKLIIEHHSNLRILSLMWHPDLWPQPGLTVPPPLQST
jgi:hypothetical protein